MTMTVVRRAKKNRCIAFQIGEAAWQWAFATSFSGGMEGQKIGRNLGLHMHVDAFRPRCHFLLGRRQLCDQRLTTRPRCTRELRAQDEVSSVCIMYVLFAQKK